eukprot:Opistho-1_new@75018
MLFECILRDRFECVLGETMQRRHAPRSVLDRPSHKRVVAFGVYVHKTAAHAVQGAGPVVGLAAVGRGCTAPRALKVRRGRRDHVLRHVRVRVGDRHGTLHADNGAQPPRRYRDLGVHELLGGLVHSDVDHAVRSHLVAVRDGVAQPRDQLAHKARASLAVRREVWAIVRTRRACLLDGAAQAHAVRRPVNVGDVVVRHPRVDGPRDGMQLVRERDLVDVSPLALVKRVREAVERKMARNHGVDGRADARPLLEYPRDRPEAQGLVAVVKGQRIRRRSAAIPRLNACKAVRRPSERMPPSPPAVSLAHDDDECDGDDRHESANERATCTRRPRRTAQRPAAGRPFCWFARNACDGRICPHGKCPSRRRSQIRYS